MADTDATFIGTEKYYEVYGQGEPSGSANDVESLWNDEVADGGDYDINIDTDSGVDISETDTMSDALSYVRTHPIVQTHLNYHDKDAVIVVDARSYSPSGTAYGGTAGSDWAVGIVSPDSSSTAAHELAHIYGASHTDFVNFGWFSHTLMENDEPSCNGNDPQLMEEMTYSDCTIEDSIREHDVF